MSEDRVTWKINNNMLASGWKSSHEYRFTYEEK